MSLHLYSSPDETAKFDSIGPFMLTFDGRIGGQIDRLVYVRNDDILRYYTNIQVVPVDSSGDNIVDGTATGFFWKLMVKDIAPTNTEWALVSPGNTISLSSLGDTAAGDIVTYLPFWVRVAIPRSQRIQTITDVTLRITATESVIGG